MNQLNRRQFVLSAAALAASPAILVPGVAVSAQKVDPESAAAKALQYVHESPDAGKVCSNCQLFQASSDAAWGPCAIFPGQQVAGAGWCSAWVAKQG